MHIIYFYLKYNNFKRQLRVVLRISHSEVRQTHLMLSSKKFDCYKKNIRFGGMSGWVEGLQY